VPREDGHAEEGDVCPAVPPLVITIADLAALVPLAESMKLRQRSVPAAHQPDDRLGGEEAGK